MKKFFTNVLMSIGIVLLICSCGSSQKILTSTTGIPQNIAITSPSKVYVGEMEFGYGRSFNKGQAYTTALRNAQENMATRLYRSISIVDEEFSRDTQNSVQMNTVSNRTSKIVGVIDNKVLSISLMKDPAYTQNSDGIWDCTVQVMLDSTVVKKMAHEIYNTLSDDDVIRVKFEEQQFQEEFEKQLQEYRKTHK